MPSSTVPTNNAPVLQITETKDSSLRLHLKCRLNRIDGQKHHGPRSEIQKSSSKTITILSLLGSQTRRRVPNRPKLTRSSMVVSTKFWRPKMTQHFSSMFVRQQNSKLLRHVATRQIPKMATTTTTTWKKQQHDLTCMVLF